MSFASLSRALSQLRNALSRAVSLSLPLATATYAQCTKIFLTSAATAAAAVALVGRLYLLFPFLFAFDWQHLQESIPSTSPSPKFPFHYPFPNFPHTRLPVRGCRRCCFVPGHVCILPALCKRSNWNCSALFTHSLTYTHTQRYRDRHIKQRKRKQYDKFSVLILVHFCFLFRCCVNE